ncbi:DNA polymerase delta, subunit 4-domain-containing protein [Panaeolus papilionaceus]|nr:DNA polymerase delta, subunit 4-domain-containing protein [Panaeolus papilionaceus]
MAPKTSKKSATPMTQSILGFSSTKRTASAANLAKKPGVKPTASVLSDARKVSTGSEFDDISLASNSTLSEDDPIEDSFDASDRKTERKVDTEERTQTVSKRLAATKLSQEAELKKERTRAVKPEPTKAVVPEELPELNPQDTKWRKPFAQAKAKMGNLQTIHAQNQTKIHDILRVFDNTYEYGPCVGMSRLDRWERAEALGLNPPKEVYDILQTKQGSTLDEYTQSVFYGQV